MKKNPRLKHLFYLIFLFSGLSYPVFSTAAENNNPNVSLTMRDLAIMALQNNQELEVERLNPEIQRQAIREARGAFNPNLVVTANHEDTERNLDQRSFNGVSNILFGGSGEDSTIFEEVNTGIQSGIEGLLPTGAEYNLSLLNRLIDNDSNDFETEYTSEVNLILKQPLLRRFGTRYNFTVVRLAENRFEQEEFRLRSNVLGVLQNTLTSAAELLFAQENLRVKNESIALAERFVSENRRRLEEGRMSEIDVIQAQTRLSEAKEEALQARGFYIQRLSRLKALIYQDANANYQQTISINDTFSPFMQLPIRRALLRTAKEQNPSYLLARKQIEERDITLDRAEQDILPELNLIAGIGYQGLSFNSNYDAVKDWDQRSGPNWQVGVEFSIPLGNDTALSARRAALLGKRQAEINLGQIENLLVTSLDQTLGSIEIAKEVILTARESVEFAKASLEAEEKRLLNGRSTSFNVAELQRNLSVAQSRELASQVEYEKALLNLWTLLGVLDLRMNLKPETRNP